MTWGVDARGEFRIVEYRGVVGRSFGLAHELVEVAAGKGSEPGLYRRSDAISVVSYCIHQDN